MSEQEKKFCKRYQATIRPGGTQYHRMADVAIIGVDRYDYEMTRLECKTVNSVEIVMPEDRYRALIEKEAYLAKVLDSDAMLHKHPADQILDDYDRECRIRNECPSVMIAYQKYKHLLSLVESSYG